MQDQIFLKKIVVNQNIPSIYKTFIGEYVNLHENDFYGLLPPMESLKNSYVLSQPFNISKLWTGIKDFCQKKLSPAHYPPQVDYVIESSFMERKHWHGNFDTMASQIKQKFLTSITTNNLFVNDEYYNTYLAYDNKEFELRIEDKVDPSTNLEYAQFKMLLSYLKHKKINAGFVILPLNPYCYTNLDINMSFYETLANEIKEQDFACYNLYTADTVAYDEGILEDMMHLSDYGWMKVNQFIYETYYAKEI